MSPQPKGVIPEVNARRILQALALRASAQGQVEAAVAAALAAGGSVREVAALSGLSTTTVQKYKAKDSAMTNYLVNTKDSIENISATGYEIDGDWVNFYAESSRIVASFRAETTVFIMETPEQEKLQPATIEVSTCAESSPTSEEAARANAAKWVQINKTVGL